MIIPTSWARIERALKPRFAFFRKHRCRTGTNWRARSNPRLRTVLIGWLAGIAMSLAGCASIDGGGAGGSSRVAGPLPGMAPIEAVPSVPPMPRRRPAKPGKPVGPVDAWLYVSASSQAELMKLGTDPTSATRIWENYFREASTPFATLTDAQALAEVAKPGVLVLPSVVVLSAAEREAILEWRNRGGAVLSTWKTGAYLPDGGSPSFDFMRDVLDVEVAGDTTDEVDDVFMMIHGDDPVANSLPAGTRVWLERVRNQLPLRLIGKHEAAQIMNWSRGYDVQKPAGLIAYNERRMPSGRLSRVVTIGYPEQNWQRSDPRQLKAITGDIMAWLQHQPRAFLGAWPYQYQSSILLALQAAEPVSDADLPLAKAVSAMGGRLTCYVHGGNAAKAAPFIRKVQALGHEIAYLGDTFEGFKDQPVATQAERLDAMKNSIASAGIRLPASAGFAPPLDSYDAATLQLLQERGFDTYMTFMETTETRLPFLAERDTPGTPTVVLARTLIAPEEALEEDADGWLEDYVGAMKLSARMGGMSIIRIPTRSFVVAEQMNTILDTMRSLGKTAWIASAHQIAEWWRYRSKVSIEFDREGEAGVLTVSVANAAKTPPMPVSVWLSLPQMHGQVRLEPVAHHATDRKTADQRNDAGPRVVEVDAWRSLVTWKHLAPGTHRWRVHFEAPRGAN